MTCRLLHVFNPESLNVHQKKNISCPSGSPHCPHSPRPPTWGCLVSTCLTPGWINSWRSRSLVHSSGCVGNSQEKKPAGFDATNSAWAFTGFEAELLRDEKEKVLSLAEIRFRMWKITGEKTKAFCLFCLEQTFFVVCLLNCDTAKLVTPWKINVEPEDDPIEKEHHLPNLHFWVPC